MLLQSVDTSEYTSNKIDLGRQGEHDVRQIVFDLSPLTEEAKAAIRAMLGII